ncbi:MAG: arsenate reductase ArsC [Candidatus Melainabacteria bacterium]|nr:arsenate reductase ArsC [Candidatus Melainabacteria bacterium]
MKVLFLCTGNSCRSQMAEGLLRHFHGTKHEAYSAGIHPSTVNPNAIKVMNEIGIDISNQRSKSVNEYLGQSFDKVITVCDNAKESCPVFPGKAQRSHWSFIDPALATGTEDEKLKVFRAVRDQIQAKITEVF